MNKMHILDYLATNIGPQVELKIRELNKEALREKINDRTLFIFRKQIY